MRHPAATRCRGPDAPTLAGPEVATWRRAWAVGETRKDRRRMQRGPL